MPGPPATAWVPVAQPPVAAYTGLPYGADVNTVSGLSPYTLDSLATVIIALGFDGWVDI